MVPPPTLDAKFTLALLKKYCFDTLNVGNFLPEGYVAKENSRIKFRILHPSSSTWNVIEPLISILKQIPAYDLLVVLTKGGDLPNRISQCSGIGAKYKIVDHPGNNYDVALDKPDIFLVYNMFSKADAGDLRAHSKLIVAVASHVNCEREDISEFCQFVNFETLGRYRPDYFLVDALLYQHFRKQHPPMTKVVAMGNPKFDNMYKALQRQTPVPGWEKLRHKKVLCYCPDHGIYGYTMGRTFGLDLYGKAIFAWAHSHKQCALIFRPHPVMLTELLRHGIWDQEDIYKLQEAVRQSDNIVWDEHQTYNEAFATCDAILTDAHCGITCTALPTGKPVGALYREDEDSHIHKEIGQALYEIKDANALAGFLQMVADGEDPRKQEREEIIKNSFLNFDGKNAKRIIDFIEGKYRSKSQASGK